MNGRIYRYLISNPLAPPVIFSDPALGIDSFHIRCALSACGKYLACGSNHGGVFVWSVEHPEWPPIRLITSTIEVSLVIWNPFQTTRASIATGSVLCNGCSRSSILEYNGDDPQPWIPQLAPFSLQVDAFECFGCSDHSRLKMKEAAMHIPALMQLPSLVELSTFHPSSQPTHSHLSSPPTSTVDADYEVMLKENCKPNHHDTFGTPIKFPFSPKDNTHSGHHQSIGYHQE